MKKILVLILLFIVSYSFSAEGYDIIKKGDLEALKELIEKKPELLKKKPRGTNATLLHQAAHHGHPEIVEYLLSKGMDVNAMSSRKVRFRLV